MDKQLNTYMFTNNLKYGLLNDNYFIGAKEIFNSTITNSSTKSIKDEHNLYLIGGFKIIPEVSAGLTLNNIVFSDVPFCND